MRQFFPAFTPLNMRFFKRATLVFILWFFIHILVIILDGLLNNRSSAEVAVILGNKVNEDGSLSERLTKRLECGLSLFREGRIKKIIVSGGLGTEGYYEGDKMKEFLIVNHVPDSVIIVDNHGDNTELTVLNVLDLQKRIKFKGVMVVSQYFHITRTKMLFRKHGFISVNSTSPVYFEARDIYSLTREFFAFYQQLF